MDAINEDLPVPTRQTTATNAPMLASKSTLRRVKMERKSDGASPAARKNDEFRGVSDDSLPETASIMALLPNSDGRWFIALCCLRRSRSEEHTSELQSLMRISYAVFCLKKKTDHIK